MKVTNLLFVAGLLSLTKRQKKEFKADVKEILYDYKRVYKKHTESEVGKQF